MDEMELDERKVKILDAIIWRQASRLGREPFQSIQI